MEIEKLLKNGPMGRSFEFSSRFWEMFFAFWTSIVLFFVIALFYNGVTKNGTKEMRRKKRA